MYTFSNTWFTYSDIRNNIDKFVKKDNINHILEIGCFEGQSTCFFSDHYIDNIYSTLDCIDPHYVSGTVKEITSQHITLETKTIFENNIQLSKNYKKMRYFNITSDDFFKNNIKKYNFIYIDGCHEPDYIKRDIENSFDVLKLDGIMWLDDYMGGKNRGDNKKVIDTVLSQDKYNGKFIIIYSNYQLAIRKINN